jgi:hypothetical protein
MSRSRLLPLILLAVAALTLSACGNKHARVTQAETEGVYLDVGELKYQVQISRLLNPTDREDQGYLVGVPGADQLGAKDSWFAVFVRAENESSSPQPMAEEYVIKDSQGNEFRPVEPGADNVFALRPGELGAGEIYPLLSTPAAESTIQGSMLLYKIPYANLENRPLDLEIVSPTASDDVGSVELDI